jgi:hypothetical protein
LLRPELGDGESRADLVVALDVLSKRTSHVVRRSFARQERTRRVDVRVVELLQLATTAS